MTMRTILILIASLLFEYTCAITVNNAVETGKTTAVSQASEQEKDDLKTAASNGYPDRYDWNRGYAGGYGATGYGSLDDRYGGYDSSYGYSGYDGDYSRQGSGYPGGASYGGYQGGYGGSYGSGNGGYGGYGGYAGSGGLNSYYGYNNPSYQGGNNHLGYGYYRRPGYGNIYNSGITPSLVTGYRGYSRK